MLVHVGTWAQPNSIPTPGPSVASFPEWQTLGTLQVEAKARAFTAVHWVLVRTVLAIHVTVASPPLGDTVPVAALEVGGLARVIDGCQQERREKVSMPPSPPLLDQPPWSRTKRDCTG